MMPAQTHTVLHLIAEMTFELMVYFTGWILKLLGFNI